MADLIYYILMYDEPITFSVLEGFLGAVYADVKREYTTEKEQKAMVELWTLIEKAISQAADITELDEFAIPSLGEGWTGDEALAIAIYCTLKHLDSFEDALAAAVNHDGDSDSTGAICGNLMGAIMGYDTIPQNFKQKLELRGLIVDIADDILKGCTISEYHAPETPDEVQWEKRYVKIEPVGPNRYKGVLSFLNMEYHIMPQAQRALEINGLFKQIREDKSEVEKCKTAYKIAIKVFDATFNPRKLSSSNEPQSYFNIKEFTPAYYYGYSDRKYSPHNSNRVFKLNVRCFNEESPVIAVRDDCNCQRYNELQAGLTKYHNEAISMKYPGWEFYRIERSTADGNYAVFTNQLEKEFAVEIAHLWEDGTLHRIYRLDY